MRISQSTKLLLAMSCVLALWPAGYASAATLIWDTGFWEYDDWDADTDGDGLTNYFDLDDDNDGVEDVNDAFPLNAAESADTDVDGIGNNADWDDDNDGVPDTVDAAPLDALNASEVNLPLDGEYKGRMIQDQHLGLP